jgi:hypothetical protein
MMTLSDVRKRLATILGFVMVVVLVGCASIGDGGFEDTRCERCEVQCEDADSIADCIEACLRDCDPGL